MWAFENSCKNMKKTPQYTIKLISDQRNPNKAQLSQFLSLRPAKDLALLGILGIFPSYNGLETQRVTLLFLAHIRKKR